jgi:hypothetical protein
VTVNWTANPAAKVTANLTPREFASELSDPRVSETFSAATGTPMLVVHVTDAAGGAVLADLDLDALPCAVVLVVPDPAVIRDARTLAVGDVVLTEDPQAPRPMVADTDALNDIERAITANPIAAASAVLLLRGSETRSVADGLIAESSTYSTLQAGAEFHRWRADRPVKPADSDDERVRLQRDGDVLRITLARPGRRNALDAKMRDALSEALELAATDRDCRVEIDALGPDFCAGGDLDEFGSRPDPAIGHVTRLSRSPARLLHHLADRTVVRVHGACMGSGIELPSFTGRVISTMDARFGLPELSLGLIPGAGGTVSVPRRIGRHRTTYLTLSGRFIDARQALSWSLVDELS